MNNYEFTKNKLSIYYEKSRISGKIFKGNSARTKLKIRSKTIRNKFLEEIFEI
jgi:hypothetical protein